MILLPSWKPIFVELGGTDQEITLGRKQAVDVLAGFMRFVNRFIHFKM